MIRDIPEIGGGTITELLFSGSAINGEGVSDRAETPEVVGRRISIALAVPEELGELDCLVTESEEEEAAVEAERVGVEGEGGAADRLPNKEGRPPVDRVGR